MLLVDARRLTGPNLLARVPLVVVEVQLDVPDVLSHARDTYLAELARMRVALGFLGDVTNVIVRRHRGGAVIAYEAPIDVMLPCTEMSEWAVLSACEVLASRPPLDLEPKRAEIEAMLARERAPQMVTLAMEANKRGLPFLWDDNEVTIGAGARAITWPRSQLPTDLSSVKWEALGTIPIALVSGTNGKTTSARLLARMIKESGKKVGSTSSDAITVDGEVVDTGDWTGPAAARAVLRRKDVEIAVLETARGGLLRRGLAMEEVDCALITNVSEDHTGGYGIDDLAAMTMVKAIVARAVRSKGTVVLSAHDDKLVRLRDELMKENPDRTFVLFADLERGDVQAKETIAQHRGLTVTAENGRLAGLIDVAAVPITFGGVARYNVENALGAIAMARALGVGDDAICRGLAGFGSNAADNPRRGTLLEKEGVRIMLDFGHNPEGVRAVLALVNSLRGGKGRLFVVAGSAGDRTNDEIGRMCMTIAKYSPHRVYLRELAGYMRGRLPGEMPRLFKRSLTANGVTESSIVNAASEAEAVEEILRECQPGDFAVVLVHLDHEEVQRVLSAASWPS